MQRLKLKYYFFILFGMLLSRSAGAQNKKDAIEVIRVKWITDSLRLTPLEAQQFWPLYNDYQQKLEDLRVQRRQARRNMKENFEGMSDKDIEAFIDQELDFKQKELDLAKDFHKKMKAVLPMKKVAVYYRTIEQFNKWIVEHAGQKNGPK